MNREGFDPQALLDRLHGDLNSLQELVDLFGTEVPKMLASIEKPIQQGSASDLEKAAHKIKGSMFQLSAHAAADTALQIRTGRTGSMEGNRNVVGKAYAKS